MPPSSFLIRRTRAAIENILRQINPLLKYLLIYFFITKKIFLDIK